MWAYSAIKTLAAKNANNTDLQSLIFRESPMLSGNCIIEVTWITTEVRIVTVTLVDSWHCEDKYVLGNSTEVILTATPCFQNLLIRNISGIIFVTERAGTPFRKFFLGSTQAGTPFRNIFSLRRYNKHLTSPTNFELLYAFPNLFSLEKKSTAYRPISCRHCTFCISL
jgi:hypothetical protein